MDSASLINTATRLEASEKMVRTLDDLLDKQGNLITYFFEKKLADLHREMGKTDPEFNRKKYDKGEYPCIHLDQARFIKVLTESMKLLDEQKISLWKTRFLDAGCGIGHKLLLAQAFRFGRITGMEIENRYILEARKLIREFVDYDPFMPQDRYSSYRPRMRIIRRNILQADYSHYNLIYFYVPLYNSDKERQFEQRVIETSKPNTVIAGMCNRTFRESKELIKVSKDHEIYLKK